MVKQPVAGRVKTRLARDVGTPAATRFLRANLSNTLLRLAADPRWHTLLSVSPDAAVASPMLPEHLDRMAQGGGDIGERMARAALLAPPGPLVIIGADIPGITPAHIAPAFAALGNASAVFGPASDGGYWLVGLSAKARNLAPFCNVRWSSPHALADTRANLTGHCVREVATMHDIDTAADLSRLSALAGRLVVPRQSA